MATKAERRAARERVSAYHQAQLAELLSRRTALAALIEALQSATADRGVLNNSRSVSG